MAVANWLIVLPPTRLAIARSAAIFLSIVSTCVRKRPLRDILDVLHIPFPPNAAVRRLRALLKDYIRKEGKGKQVSQPNDNADDRCQQQRSNAEWPEILSSSVKDKRVSAFQEETSSAALSCFTVRAAQRTVHDKSKK